MAVVGRRVRAVCGAEGVVEEDVGEIVQVVVAGAGCEGYSEERGSSGRECGTGNGGFRRRLRRRDVDDQLAPGSSRTNRHMRVMVCV